MSEAVDAIVAGIVAEPGWAADPAAYVARYVGWAADAADPAVHGGAIVRVPLNTHVACALVRAARLAGHAAVLRGTVLDALVERYGDGGYS